MLDFVKSGTGFIFIFYSLFVLLQGCQTNPPEFDTTERLIAQPPSGWIRTYQLNQEGERISEFSPADEDKNKWVNKISFESSLALQHADPIELLLKDAEEYKKRCNFVQHFNLFSGYENSYPTSLRLIMCGKSKQLDTGEVSMIKAIQGDEHFYVVKLTRKVAPFEPHKPDVTETEIAEWSTYMKRIFLCNPQTPQHPCPVTDSGLNQTESQ